MEWWQDTLIGAGAGIVTAFGVLRLAYVRATKDAARQNEENQKGIKSLQEQAYRAGLRDMMRGYQKELAKKTGTAEGQAAPNSALPSQDQ